MTPLQRIGSGTITLCCQCGKWINSGTLKDALTRAAGTASLAFLIGGLCLGAPILTIPVTAVWLLSAWHASSPSPTDPDSPETPPIAGQSTIAPTAGEGFTIMDDPANPGRHHVIWKKEAA